ncbi:RNA-guided endonuclease InsQ/TnpB family protein [Archaeoglobus profundus]|uniref:Transposase, IS605 OrfB family n=1 Tax=Archaeoglobus profundus (strain DSM 5631 / JCM 9629 / NBRC 100127 / Av18) TaxID=572546 RepID=D2RHQ6_ARCPA|nr:RNA-guided endonuclease TnpB family protein [Archaeoglobus profundus]ADB57831.1 transposase, IS605 OrfB family [Archaeoglobus profundus DSM 5631]
MKLTLKMKVREKTKWKIQALRRAMETFRDAVNDWIDVAWKHKIADRTLHEIAYKELRQKYRNLYSNSLQDAMNWAIQIVKTELKLNPNKKPEFKTLMISFKNVDFKFENNGFVIPLNGKRVYVPVYVPKKYYKWLVNGKFGRLYFKEEDGEIYAYLTVKVEDKPVYEPKSWFGVDLGVHNLAVVADERGRKILRFDGEIVNRYKELLEKERARRQKRQMKEFNNKEHKYGCKHRSFSRYVNHVVSKEIVRKAKEYKACIVLEKLRGVKRRGARKPKRVRKLLHRWSYHDLIQKIKYKAKLEGVPVIEISPRNTSKTCSNCGFVYKRFKDQRLFHCPKCGIIIDRDLNASINIARKGREEYKKRAFLSALKSEASSPQWL